MTEYYDKYGNQIRYKNNRKRVDDKKRTGLTTALASYTQPLLSKALGKRGISDIRIISNWGQIVGAELAQVSAPVNIKYRAKQRTNGILYISVVGAYATEMAYQSGVIVEKINSFIGYGAISDIRLKHDFVLKEPKIKIETGEIKSDSQELKKMLSCVADDEIKQSLLRLGRHIIK